MFTSDILDRLTVDLRVVSDRRDPNGFRIERHAVSLIGHGTEVAEDLE
jgi:hypothetical protein